MVWHWRCWAEKITSCWWWFLLWGGFSGILATLSQTKAIMVISFQPEEYLAYLWDPTTRAVARRSSTEQWAKFFLYYQAQNVDNTASPERFQFEMTQNNHLDHILSVDGCIRSIDCVLTVCWMSAHRYHWRSRRRKRKAEPSSSAPFLHDLHPARSRIAQDSNLKIAQKPNLIAIKANAVVSCLVLFL